MELELECVDELEELRDEAFEEALDSSSAAREDRDEHDEGVTFLSVWRLSCR